MKMLFPFLVKMPQTSGHVSKWLFDNLLFERVSPKGNRSGAISFKSHSSCLNGESCDHQLVESSPVPDASPEEKGVIADPGSASQFLSLKKQQFCLGDL